MAQQLSTNTFTTAKWIVSATASQGTHTTITAAMSSASSGDTIFVFPGTYTENFTTKAGVNITAYPGDGFTPTVTIVGTVTMTATGTSTISGIRLQTNSANIVSVTGTNVASLILQMCYLNCTNNTGLSLANANAEIQCYNCNGDIGTTGIGLYAVTAGNLGFRNCRFTNSGNTLTASNSTGAGNSVAFIDCVITFPLSTSANSMFISATGTIFNTAAGNTVSVTLAGSGGSNFMKCDFQSGTAASLSIGAGCTAEVSDCSVSNSNGTPITGAGTLAYSPITFYGAGLFPNTTTQTTRAFGPRIRVSGVCEVIAGSGDPNGSITAPQGSLWLRSDGSAGNNRAFINTTGGTVWTAITTVA